MAFQQPQRPQAARNLSYSTAAIPRHVLSLGAAQSSLEQPRERVLFSPTPASLTEVRTVSTARTPRTAGRSHLSELGSLDTAAVSDEHDAEDIQDEDLETEDMDSLDDGLHAFHEPISHDALRQSLGYSAETVLPTHDGLGTFPGDSNPVQEQLWQHERHNPRRRQQLERQSSLLRADVLNKDQQQSAEEERFLRIERWRMDQSRAILEEIERETKRKRRRNKVETQETSSGQSQVPETPVSEHESFENVSQSPVTPDTESFWTRFTRKVIRDLMGFDDATLSIILGEDLVEERSQIPSAAEIVEQAQQSTPEDVQLAGVAKSWEGRLLARIAKELGTLVNQLSEHPGAFSTYLQAQDPPPYAGLPNPPSAPSQRYKASRRSAMQGKHVSTSEPHFTPTLANHHPDHHASAMDASLWGIEEEAQVGNEQHPTESTRLQGEREYWERDFDVKMVFGFLRTKLSSSPPASSQPTFANAPARGLDADHRNAASSLRRVALIRHHHPLVSRNVATAASVFKASPDAKQSRAATLSPPLLRRRHSGIEGSVASCASQSTKRSKTGKSGSSRNYWDVGAGTADSLGSGGWGSAGWGEV